MTRFTIVLAALLSTASWATEPPRESLRDYGFVHFEDQRDAAHQILSIYGAQGDTDLQSPGGKTLATLLRMFAGGEGLSGDVIRLPSDSENPHRPR